MVPFQEHQTFSETTWCYGFRSDDTSPESPDLFGAAGIAADANGDGYADRLKVCIGVEAGLTDAGVWAQVLNLAARLAGEVTALDLPVVKSAQRVAAGEAALVVHRPSNRTHPGPSCGGRGVRFTWRAALRRAWRRCSTPWP